MPVASATAAAPAKINLVLEVLGPRGDGYHEIRSVAIGIDLCDRATVRSGGADGVRIRCSDRELATPSNSAYLAAERFAARVGRTPAFEVDVYKRIPVGGGMGGGSSDAAATLRACSSLWDHPLDEHDLIAIGAGIGSDVPLFFKIPSVRMTGRGEHVERFDLAWSGWVLLVFTGPVVSTAAVYAAWRPSNPRAGQAAAVQAIAGARTAGEMNTWLFNDLEPAVFAIAPRVSAVFQALHCAGAGPFRVTGAGSTLFRLFDDEEEARRIGRDVEGMGLDVATAVVAAPAGPGKVVVCEDA